jgi:predicted transcriptional regulator
LIGFSGAKQVNKSQFEFDVTSRRVRQIIARLVKAVLLRVERVGRRRRYAVIVNPQGQMMG